MFDFLVLISIIITAILIVIIATLIYKSTVKIDCANNIHHFEPMYDEEIGKPNITKLTNVFPEDMKKIISASRPRKTTFVKSVCRHCGKSVYRNE